MNKALIQKDIRQIKREAALKINIKKRKKLKKKTKKI